MAMSAHAAVRNTLMLLLLASKAAFADVSKALALALRRGGSSCMRRVRLRYELGQSELPLLSSACWHLTLRARSCS